jgi:hypothetical protein
MKRYPKPPLEKLESGEIKREGGAIGMAWSRPNQFAGYRSRTGSGGLHQFFFHLAARQLGWRRARQGANLRLYVCAIQRLNERRLFCGSHNVKLKNREKIMPQGDKSKYSSKQKRKAEHIEKGYEKGGTSKKEAERRAWATVNKEDKGGKKSGSGRGKKSSKASSRKGGRKGGKASGGRKKKSSS